MPTRETESAHLVSTQPPKQSAAVCSTCYTSTTDTPQDSDAIVFRD